MDLNELLLQHQIALMNAACLARDTFLGSRFDMVQHYERRLRKLRRELGEAQYPEWPVPAGSGYC